MPSKTFTIAKDTRLLSPDLGSGKCAHLPVGLGSGVVQRALLQFSLNWSGVTAITSAQLHIRVSDHYHVAPDSISVYVQRLTGSWTENSAGHPATTAATAYPGPAAVGAGQVTASIPSTANSWRTIDITAIVTAWAASGIGGGGQGNYGIRLISTSEGSNGAVEFWSRESGSDPYISLTYESNTAPSAPTLTAPVSGSIIVGTVATLGFTHSDPQGDVCAAYDVEVDATTGNGVAPDWASPAWSSYASTTGINGNYVTRATGALTRGQWYGWRARTKDPAGLWSPWSALRYFKINSLPVATPTSPAAGGFAVVRNLHDLAVWTAAGSHAQSRYGWSFSDADGQAQSGYRVRLYSAATGGTLLADTDHVTSSAKTHDGATPFVNGTQYWWTIEVWDTSGESSDECARSAFKVRWAQAIYEYQPTGGVNTSGWAFSAGAVSGGSAAFLYATATGAGGAGRSAWKSTIGSLTPAAYLNVLVRLSSLSASQPSLADMTFSYLASAILPDRWSFGGAVWRLDPSVRRFGIQSLCCQPDGAGTSYTARPYRLTPGDDVLVQPGVTYTLSGRIKTDGVLHSGAAAFIAAYALGWDDPLAYTASVTDSSASPDGWQPVSCTFMVPPGQTTVMISAVYYDATPTSGDTVWFDGFKLEEGTVATAWTPGFVGDAVVLDANGVAIDGSAGGIFRLRGNAGGARDVVELGANGLVLGGDVAVSSPTTGKLLVDGRFVVADKTALSVDGEIVLSERGDMGNASANQAYLWIADNGAGKTVLRVRFASGNIITLATEV